MTLRLLEKGDIPAAREIWHQCFKEDSDAFLDWFFTKRCDPSLSAGCFEDGALVSVMHGTVMPLTSLAGVLPALMVSGVATVPERRGQGYMHRTMLFLRQKAQERGINILFNHPQDPDAYKRLGFLPCTETVYFEGNADSFAGIAPAVPAPVFSPADAHAVYEALTNRYLAFSVRDAASFLLRTEELLTDGDRAVVYKEGGRPYAYCFYRVEGDTVFCDEILSLSGYAPVLSSVLRLSGARRILAKLPPDAGLDGERRVQNIMLAPEPVYRLFDGPGALRYSLDEY